MKSFLMYTLFILTVAGSAVYYAPGSTLKKLVLSFVVLYVINSNTAHYPTLIVAGASIVVTYLWLILWVYIITSRWRRTDDDTLL